MSIQFNQLTLTNESIYKSPDSCGVNSIIISLSPILVYFSFPRHYS